MADWGGEKSSWEGMNSGTWWASNAQPSASIKTKGSWVQLVASCPRIDGFQVSVSWIGTLLEDAFFDIAIGDAGNEKIIYGDSYVYNTGSSSLVRTQSQPLEIPLSIPPNTRISARSGSSAASVPGFWVVLNPKTSGKNCFGGSFVAGVDAANYRGTAFSFGTSSMGSWSVLVASTQARIKAFILDMPKISGSASNWYQIQLAVGSTGSEQVIFFSGECGSDSGFVSKSSHGPYLCDIPPGTQISIRGANEASGKTGYAVFHGFY